MKLNLLKLGIFSLLLYSCDGERDEQTPWHNLAWLNQVETQIIVQNKQNVSQTFKIHYFNETTRETIDEAFDLTSGQIDTVSIKIFRPELIELRHSDQYKSIYLLPKKKLELSLFDTIEIGGSNKQYYSTLFEIGANEIDKIALEKILNKNDTPNWLRNYLYRSNELQKLYKVHQEISYQQFIGNKDIAVSQEDSSMTARMLQSEVGAQFHNYYSLLQKFKSFYETRAHDEGNPIENESYKLNKNLAEMLLKIETPELKNEMLAIHTEGLLIRKRKTFKGKDEVYSQIISNLPEDYVLKLNEIEKEYDLPEYNQNAVIELLQKEVLSINEEKIPLTSNLKAYKLLKFWFAGCAPCKKQIPFENELLDEFENLSILHFCKNTDQKVWKEYIKENKSRGSHYYISAENLQEYIKVFSISYSPRYILLDGDNQIVCWDCANPSSPALKEMLIPS